MLSRSISLVSSQAQFGLLQINPAISPPRRQTATASAVEDLLNKVVAMRMIGFFDAATSDLGGDVGSEPTFLSHYSLTRHQLVIPTLASPKSKQAVTDARRVWPSSLKGAGVSQDGGGTLDTGGLYSTRQ